MARLVTQANSNKTPRKSSAAVAADSISAISDKTEQDATPKWSGYVRVHLHFPVHFAAFVLIPIFYCFPRSSALFALYQSHIVPILTLNHHFQAFGKRDLASNGSVTSHGADALEGVGSVGAG